MLNSRHQTRLDGAAEMMLLLTVIGTGAVLIGVSMLTSSLEIDGLGAAFTPGLAIAAVGYAMGFLLSSVMPREGFGPFGNLWGFIAFQAVVNTIVLGLASLMAPGVRFKGWGTFLITSVLLNVVIVLGPYGLNQFGLLSPLLGI